MDVVHTGSDGLFELTVNLSHTAANFTPIKHHHGGYRVLLNNIIMMLCIIYKTGVKTIAITMTGALIVVGFIVFTMIIMSVVVVKRMKLKGLDIIICAPITIKF